MSLSIKIEMKQILDATPPQVSLGALRPGATTNLSVVLHRVDGQKLVVAKTEPSSKFLTVHVEPIEGSNDQSAKLVIDARPDGTPRPINENVKVYLDGISQPAMTVGVAGRLLGDLVLDHEQLYWPITDSSHTPMQDAQSLPVRRITVSSTRSDKALEITNLSTSLTNLTVELVTVETGKVYNVVAKLTESPKQSERGTISFDSNASAQPKIVIPVTIIVLKSNDGRPSLP